VTPIAIVFALILAQPAEVETRMILLSSENHVMSRCGGPFPACTRFVGHQLTASCAMTTGGTFTMRVTPSYTALVYLTGADYLRHESLHIKDVDRAVARHIDRLESDRFDSQPACERAATTAAESFAAALRSFAAASNAERH
jgi:hypothetical protein